MLNPSDVNRPRDHLEASSESLQSSTAHLPMYGLTASARTSTNGTTAASRPTTNSLGSGNRTPNAGSLQDSSSSSNKYGSHLKAPPYSPITRPRSSPYGPSSATEASTDGTRLRANGASKHGPHAASGASISEPCSRTGAPTWKWPVTSSQSALLTSSSMSRSITGEAPTARHHPRPGSLSHFQSSAGTGTPN